MPSIFLIRHGQASFGQENYDQLSGLGKRQAAHLGIAWGQRLPGFDAVVRGSMQRHLQTAELCLEGMGQDFRARVHSALSEIVEEFKSARNIAVFTSGGPISLLSQYLLGVPEHKIMHLNWTLVNCGVTKIVATGSRMFIASLNQHVHFEHHNNKSMITYK